MHTAVGTACKHQMVRTSPRRRSRSAHPCPAPLPAPQRFVGQCNLQTDIKEACFLGADDALVAAGSDDGRVFIFNAATGECVRWVSAVHSGGAARVTAGRARRRPRWLHARRWRCDRERSLGAARQCQPGKTVPCASMPVWLQGVHGRRGCGQRCAAPPAPAGAGHQRNRVDHQGERGEGDGGSPVKCALPRRRTCHSAALAALLPAPPLSLQAPRPSCSSCARWLSPAAPPVLCNDPALDAASNPPPGRCGPPRASPPLAGTLPRSSAGTRAG